MSFTVMYKCKCMTAERKIHVRNRFPTEYIADWMDVVADVLSRDHRARSPKCAETKMEYAKLPMPENAPGIGMPPKFDA